MSFQTAGKGEGGHEKSEKASFLTWENLKEGFCPKCGDDLKDFSHLELWKCFCGFKISYFRMKEILDKMDGDEDYFWNGFGYSAYDWEPPF